MKIAIMTQPLGQNYGGIMQAWALQQVLKRMGHEPVTIDRQPDPRSLGYRCVRRIYRLLNSAIGKKNSPIIPERTLATVTSHTRAFIRSYLEMSAVIDSTEKLRAHFTAEGYRAVIVGSDQTWRPIYSPNINNFFLDFVSDGRIKKFAYASSFGVDRWEFSQKETRKCAELARKFDFIGVREASGVELCKKYLGVTAHLVLDPTLLLSDCDYRALLEKEGFHEQKESGIYAYLLDGTPEKNSFVAQLSEKLRMKVFKRQAEESLSEWKEGAIESYQMPPVAAWLAGFNQAEFVVTDSFHGMVFSIIFGKPFFVITNPGRGTARFESLLNQLNLSDRLMHADCGRMPKTVKEALKKPDVKQLDGLRDTSLEFLLKLLNERI